MKKYKLNRTIIEARKKERLGKMMINRTKNKKYCQ